MATTLKHSVTVTEIGTPRTRSGYVIWSDLKPPIRCKNWDEVQTILKSQFC